MIEVVKLKAEDSINYFPVVVEYIKKAIDRHPFPEFGVGDILEYITDEYMDLWVIVDTEVGDIVGAGVTRIVEHPKYNECIIQLLATKTGQGFETVATKEVEKWAKANDCKRVSLVGRKGWLRVLDKQGWKELKLINMYKEI